MNISHPSVEYNFLIYLLDPSQKGPHLYAGAGLVCLWALAMACVPAMQKGDNTARTVHIGANLTGIAFFVWQVTSGVPILLKVVEFTKWP